MSESGVMDMREAFEAKMQKHWPTMNTSGSRHGDGTFYYADKTLQDAWQGFQYGHEFALSHIGDGSKAEPDGTIIARERDEWLCSDDGKRCLNLETLEGKQKYDYLRNRLELAFVAGATRCRLAHPAPTAQDSKVPEGWKLVPIEPTEHMLDSVDEYVGGSCYSCTQAVATSDDSRRIYAAMLSAAPVPEKPQWVSCGDKMPKLGQRVILMIGDAVQWYMPTLDRSDNEDFWDFEEFADGGLPVNFEHHYWMEIPTDLQRPEAPEGE